VNQKHIQCGVRCAAIAAAAAIAAISIDRVQEGYWGDADDLMRLAILVVLLGGIWLIVDRQQKILDAVADRQALAADMAAAAVQALAEQDQPDAQVVAINGRR